MNIQKYITEAHDNAIEKGFYTPGEDKNIGELLMLIVSELGEALEAHRKGKHCKIRIDLFVDYAMKEISIEDHNEEFQVYFLQNIKDTFEDELADTFIRLFDLCGYLGVEPIDVKVSMKWRSNNIADRLRQLTKNILDIDPDCTEAEFEVKLGYNISYLLTFSEYCNIPIEKHIIAKMAYNKTRPHKHGKAY